MMDGHSKSIAPVQMVRATPILLSMGHVEGRLGRWATNDSSLTPSQRRAALALELLGLEILAKRVEADGVENLVHELTRTRYRKNSNGR